MSELSKRIPGKTVDVADIYFLFYFPSDNTWEQIGLSHSCWGSKPRSQRPFLEIGEVVSLKIKGIPCSGVLCAKDGDLARLAKKKGVLLQKMDQGKFDPSASFLSDLNRSSQNVSQAAASSSSIAIGGNCNNGEIVSEATPTNDRDVDGDDSDSDSSQDEDVVEVVNDTPVESNAVESSLVSLQKETLSVLKRLNTSLERRRREDRRMRVMLSKYLSNAPSTSGLPVSVQQDQLMADSELVCSESGENLLDMVGSSASKYACNLARKLFKEDELINGMLEPQRDSPRLQLDRSKIEKIRSCVMKRFPNEDWSAVRESVNQLGRDLKRRRKLKASPLVEQDQNLGSRGENRD